MFLSVVAVLAICVDVSTMCVVHALFDRNQCVINVVHVMLMIYSWINLIEKLPIYSSEAGASFLGLQLSPLLLQVSPDFSSYHFFFNLL